MNEESPFNGEKFNGFFQMYEGDVQVQYRGFEGQGSCRVHNPWRLARINALNDLTGDDSVGNRQWGYYLVGGYNVLSLANFTKPVRTVSSPICKMGAV